MCLSVCLGYIVVFPSSNGEMASSCCLNKLHLNLTGWEGLVLHDNSAAAGQDHDVEVLLLVVGLLVPLPHHVGVMGWNQSDLIAERKGDFKVMRIRRQKKPNANGTRITILLLIIIISIL